MQVRDEIAEQGSDEALHHLSLNWVEHALRYKYCYHFTVCGRPIVQFPQDMVAMQELIWNVRPDLIIETGIAHGGSLISSAAGLALLDYTDAVIQKRSFDPSATHRHVIGIDIEIRPHNRAAIESHPLFHHIRLLEGSSTDASIVEQVRLYAQQHQKVLVCLDSNHTKKHVLQEMNDYSPFVSQNSYLVVFDTIIEHCAPNPESNRPWGVGNSPMQAVDEFLIQHPDFEIDLELQNKLLITSNPNGYLRKKPNLGI